jgi:hypothetical protein
MRQPLSGLIVTEGDHGTLKLALGSDVLREIVLDRLAKLPVNILLPRVTACQRSLFSTKGVDGLKHMEPYSIQEVRRVTFSDPTSTTGRPVQGVEFPDVAPNGNVPRRRDR